MRIRSVSSAKVVGWPAWISSLVLVALLCAVIAYWAVTLLAPRAPIAPPALTLDPRALPELQQARLLFGTDRVAQAPARLANVTVVGILAAGSRGSAILAIDERPPATFAVGEQLNTTQRLVEVRPDAVVIGSGSQRFEVPAPESGSLAVLTSGPAQAGSAGAAAPSRSANVPPRPTAGRLPTTSAGAVVPPPARTLDASPPGSIPTRRIPRLRPRSDAD